MNPLFLPPAFKKVITKRPFFWPAAAFLTTVITVWLFFKNGGITGLTREAMNLSLNVYGETVYFNSFHFFLKVSAPFLLTLAALFCWWMALRNWARYYLNRKLIVSYLFFALIPLLSTIGIFVLGVRILLGLTAAHGVEKGIQTLAKDLNNYTFNVQQETIKIARAGSRVDYQRIPEDRSSSRSVKKRIEEVLEEFKMREFSEKTFKGFSVNVFYRTAQPGQPWVCLNSTPPTREGVIFYPVLIPTNHPLFPTINPNWLNDREFSGLIQQSNQLYLKSFRYFQADRLQFVVQASLPVNTEFLTNIQERLSVNLALEGLNETWRILPESSDSAWYIRFFLRPLRSIWMVEILEWGSGKNDISAQMIFDVAPNLFSTDSKTEHLDAFLGDNQMRIQFAFIIFTITILILGQIFALIFGMFLIGYITRSLDILATGNDIVAQGQLSYRLPKMGKDQLGAMAHSFNSMVSNIQHLLEQGKEKEKLQEELRIAREIQMSLLPELENKPWAHFLDAVCIPAREVGGDYFEILEPRDRSLGVFVADVSGKGTSAAFYMAEMKGILLALKPLWNQPINLINELNSLLHQALKSNVFISAIYVLADLDTGSIECVRAGHCPAIAVWKNKPCQEIQPQGMALGLTTNQKFSPIITSQTIQLAPGEKLVLFTDGLDEMTADNEMYGLERLKSVIFENRHKDATPLKEAILADVKEFIRTGEQTDDLTLVILQMP